MLPALLLAAAPFLLIAPASAGPRILARQDLEPTCVEITETITFTTVISWLEETISLPATSSADPPTILTEHYSPIGTSSRTVPTDTIHSHSHTIPSEISSSEPTRTSQSFLPSPSGSGTPNQGGSGRYTNALYFTNWCACSSPGHTSPSVADFIYQGYIWRRLPAPAASCVRDNPCPLLVRRYRSRW